MGEPAWKTIGEAIDSMFAGIRKPAEPKAKPESQSKKTCRYRPRAEQIARRHAAEAAEKRFEAEMSERIITESALIRSEWDVQTRNSRRVGRPLDLVVPRSRSGAKRRNGVEI